MRRISVFCKALAAAVLLLCMALVVMEGMRGMRETLSVSASGQVQMSRVSAYKTLRQQVRAMEKAQLNDVAHSPDAEPEIIQMARRQLVELCAREEQEMTIEGVLSLRGYQEPVVTVHSDSVNVILQSGGITRQESSAILELVCRETGVQSGNVKIIPIN